jgi:hypothetical protein
MAEPFLRSGQLVAVLQDWSPSFDGYFLIYPGRRQVPSALRALIDMLRARRLAVRRSTGSGPRGERAEAGEPLYSAAADVGFGKSMP